MEEFLIFSLVLERLVVVTDDDVEIRYAVPTTEGSLHTRFCQLRQDYLDHPPASPVAPGTVGARARPCG